MSDALQMVRDLEREIVALETDLVAEEAKSAKLRQDNRELEQEFNHYCDNFNGDEAVIELIHDLYWTVCEKVDKQEAISLDLLDQFFAKAIDKKVAYC